MTTQLFLLAVFIFVMILLSLNHGKKKKKVIFFGDNINDLDTRPGGYISWIINQMKDEGVDEKYQVVSAVNAGEKIYDLYLRLEENVITKDASIVVIYIGANDVWDKYLKGTGTDADTFESLYQAMINKLQGANIKVIVCTPVGELKEGWPAEISSEMKDYAQIVRNIADVNGLPLADIEQAFQQAGISNDNTNPTLPASQLVANVIWRELGNLK